MIDGSASFAGIDLIHFSAAGRITDLVVMIRLIGAVMKLVPGSKAEFVRHLAQHRLRCVAEEPDTHMLKILLPHDNPEAVMLYEVYTDQADPTPTCWER